MELSRRGVLAGIVGAVGLGVGSVAAASVLTRGAPAEPTVAPPADAGSASPTPTRTPTAVAEDLHLHAWDTVVHRVTDAADATIALTSGTLPTGVSIATNTLVGRPTTVETYRFDLGISGAGRSEKRSYAGRVEPIKRDLSISLSLDARTPLTVTAKELDRIALLGANATLVVFCFISDPTSTTFTPVPDARIQRVFDLARDRGVRITLLKPHIVTEQDGDNFYRAGYAPASIDAFFAKWGDTLRHFAQLCARNDVEYLSLACEQPTQTDAVHHDRWAALVATIRAAAPEVKLTAAFTTLELFLLYTYWIPQATPHLARLLDVFGINSWVRLTDKVYTPADPNITVDELVAGWRGAGGRTDDHLGKLESVCDGLRIPFLITEVGVRPRVDGLATQDNNSPTTGAEDYEVQALLYRSVLDGPLQSRWCTGASVWHMRAPFHLGDLNGTRLYPGENVLKKALESDPALATKTF